MPLNDPHTPYPGSPPPPGPGTPPSPGTPPGYGPPPGYEPMPGYGNPSVATPDSPPAGAAKTARTVGCLVAFVLTPVLVLTMAIATTAALVAIWPGSLKLTAPVVCPAGYDDPLVVRDTTQVRPGETSTTFTLYCLNERGETADAGVLRPAALVFLAVLAGWVLLALLVLVPVFGRRRRR